MKKILLNSSILLALIFAASSNIVSADSINHSAKGSKHSALAGSHIVTGTVQSAASVVAIPLVAIGSLGLASATTGSAIIDSATAYEPLEISEIVITRDPSPEEAMQ